MAARSTWVDWGGAFRADLEAFGIEPRGPSGDGFGFNIPGGSDEIYQGRIVEMIEAVGTEGAVEDGRDDGRAGVNIGRSEARRVFGGGLRARAWRKAQKR